MAIKTPLTQLKIFMIQELERHPQGSDRMIIVAAVQRYAATLGARFGRYPSRSGINEISFDAHKLLPHLRYHMVGSKSAAA